jgi:hypothetical protein
MDMVMMNILALIGCYQIVMWVYKIGKAIVRNKPRGGKHEAPLFPLPQDVQDRDI